MNRLQGLIIVGISAAIIILVFKSINMEKE